MDYRTLAFGLLGATFLFIFIDPVTSIILLPIALFCGLVSTMQGMDLGDDDR